MTPDVKRAWLEPEIVVNGIRLTPAQAMTMRVAITHFHSQLSDERFREALGQIGPLYRQRASETLSIMLAEPATT